MQDEFENKITKQGIHYSRYIASYTKEAIKAGRPVYRDELIEWLRLVGVEPEESIEIANLAGNGKMELEFHASKWLHKVITREKKQHKSL